MDDNRTRKNVPRTFGVFYPTGHVVLAFATHADAKQARDALLTGDTKTTRFWNSVAMKSSPMLSRRAII